MSTDKHREKGQTMWREAASWKKLHVCMGRVDSFWIKTVKTMRWRKRWLWRWEWLTSMGTESGLCGADWFRGLSSSSYWLINHSANELTDTDLFIVPELPHCLHFHALQTSWIDHLMEHQGHTDYLSVLCYACPHTQLSQYTDLF